MPTLFLFTRRPRPAVRLGLLLLAAGLLTGACDDDKRIGHTPPPGQGSLVVENNTSDTIDVFLEGRAVGRVQGGKRLIVDYPPGSWRVVLAQDNDYRSYRGFADLVENRLTVMDVAYGPPYFYDLFIYFQ